MANEEYCQWIFTEDEILSSPSILDGITPDDERGRRAKGVNFIFQVGILLKLPQLTLGVASTFFHRFYMRKSMVPEKGGIHQYLPRSRKHAQLKAKNGLLIVSMEQSVAATALFLATKTEENCRKTKEVVIAVAKVAQKNASLIIDEQSKEYWRWRDSILLYEETMLEELTFDLVLSSPYNNLYTNLTLLNLGENKGVRNASWAFVNDSCMTTLALAQTSKDIAIAAVYFAVKFVGETIPDDENGNAWWEQLEGDPEKITKAVSTLATFWTENPLSRKDNPYVGAGSADNDLEQTRRRGSDEESGSQASQNGDARPASPEGEKAGSPPATNGNLKENLDVKASNASVEKSPAEKPSPKRKLDEVGNGDEQEHEFKRRKTDELSQSQESEA